MQQYDMVIHAGDVCYAGTGAEIEFEEIWDIWGNMVQEIAAYVPYMFAVGNHVSFCLCYVCADGACRKSTTTILRI